MFSSFIPEILSLKAEIPSPNGAKRFPKSSILFSPARSPAKPPLFGIAAATSARAWAAGITFFIFSMFSGVIPETLWLKAEIPLPNSLKRAPKSPMFLSPVNFEASPLIKSTPVK